jgi:hypothetical protein
LCEIWKNIFFLFIQKSLDIHEYQEDWIEMGQQTESQDNLLFIHLYVDAFVLQLRNWVITTKVTGTKSLKYFLADSLRNSFLTSYQVEEIKAIVQSLN